MKSEQTLCDPFHTFHFDFHVPDVNSNAINADKKIKIWKKSGKWNSSDPSIIC